MQVNKKRKLRLKTYVPFDKIKVDLDNPLNSTEALNLQLKDPKTWDKLLDKGIDIEEEIDIDAKGIDVDPVKHERKVKKFTEQQQLLEKLKAMLEKELDED